jgi:hypothetical protein
MRTKRRRDQVRMSIGEWFGGILGI